MAPLRLELRGVGKRFGDRAALRGVDLAVDAGEVVAVLGASGAGKSTLLRIAALLLAPGGGEVRLDGSPARLHEAALRARIGWVGQKPVVFRDTALANVALALRARGEDDAHALDEAGQALARLGLGALRDRPARRLSGGEQQRVAFARALVRRPDLLVLDEFTANLDPANVALLEAEVRRVAAGGAAVLAASHDLPQAARLADRIALLLEGRVIEVGAAKDFLAAPRTPEARAFLAGERLP